MKGVVRGGADDRGRGLGSSRSCARCDVLDGSQARGRVQGERSIPRPGRARGAEGLVGSTEHRLGLVSKPVKVEGLRKGVNVPSLSSSRRQLQHPVAGRLRASTVHEVQGDTPWVAWVGVVERQRMRPSHPKGQTSVLQGRPQRIWFSGFFAQVERWGLDAGSAGVRCVRTLHQLRPAERRRVCRRTT